MKSFEKVEYLAKNCTKSRKEWGVCYSCGASNHRLRDCRQKKQNTSSSVSAQTEKTTTQISNVEEQQVEGNEFLWRIKLQMSSEMSYGCELESQLDTASPISLVKSKFIPSNLIVKIRDNRYEGLNGSTLEILGQVNAKVIYENLIADNVILRVVPDLAMKKDTILGRDAIRPFLGLTFSEGIVKERENEKINEALNIESSVFDGNETDNLNINSELSSEVRENFLEKFQVTYLHSKRLLEPKVKVEMKLNVKDKQSFHFAPTRYRTMKSFNYEKY